MTLSTAPPRFSRLLVLYASQTGNAEWIARHIREEAELRRGYPAAVASCDEFAAGKSKPDFDACFGDAADPTLLVLVASTTGDGDVPDNATKFYRFLKRDPKRTALKDKEYLLLGLGDTNYDVFCGGAKRLDRELVKLGMKCLGERGWADDATGIEAVVDPWIAKLWHLLPDLVVRDPTKATLAHEGSKPMKRPPPPGSPKRSPLAPPTVAAPAAQVPPAAPRSSGEIQTPTPVRAETTDSVKDIPLFLPQPAIASPPTPTPAQVLATAPIAALPAAVPILNVVPASGIAASTYYFAPPADPAPLFDFSTELAKYKQLTNVTKSPLHALTLVPTARSLDHTLVSDASLPFCHDNPCRVRIAAQRVLTGSKALQPVIELQLDSIPWTWQPGDALGILAPNPPELVAAMLALIPIDADAELTVTGADKLGLSGSISARLALERLTDLVQFPNKNILRMLADRAQAKEEKKRLLFLCSKEGIASFRTLRESGMTLPDVLGAHRSALPASNEAVVFLAGLLEHAARLQPRYYSFASAPGDTVRIAFNLQEWTTTWGSRRRGVATGHMAALAAGTELCVFPRAVQGIFAAPEPDQECNVLLIASGTGITPFRGFLEQRAKLGEKKGNWWLVYGCRFGGIEGDASYLDEIESWKNSGVLSRLDVVFSRDTASSQVSSGSQEVSEADKGNLKYVQHVLRHHASDVYEFLKPETSIVYLCGDAKTMGKGVSSTLGDIWEEKEGLKKGEGIEFWMEKRAEEGGYRRDVWG